MKSESGFSFAMASQPFHIHLSQGRKRSVGRPPNQGRRARVPWWGCESWRRLYGSYVGICSDEVSPLQLRPRCFAGTLSQSRESTCGPGGPTSTDLMHSSPSFYSSSYINKGFSNSFIQIFIFAYTYVFFQRWKHDFFSWVRAVTRVPLWFLLYW